MVRSPSLDLPLRSCHSCLKYHDRDAIILSSACSFNREKRKFLPFVGVERKELCLMITNDFYIIIS